MKRTALDRSLGFAAVFLFTIAGTPVLAQTIVTAQPRAGQTPPWDKGILPISPESYYNAIECGKQGGADPPCVFWDTGLCKNADFTLTMYSPYKSVAYEVWRVVNQKQPPPKPSYPDAQRTRVTVGVMPAGAKNPLTNLVLKHGAQTMMPVDRSVSAGGGRFTFDFPAFAANADVTIDLVGQARTISCRIPQSVLKTFR